MSYGEKSKGNRRRKWEKRKVKRDGKRKNNESGQRRKNRPNHVRVTNAVNQQVNDDQNSSAFLNGTLRVYLRLRFVDVKWKESLESSQQQQKAEVSFEAFLNWCFS